MVVLKYRRQLVQIRRQNGFSANDDHPAVGIVKTSETTVITSQDKRKSSARTVATDRPFSGYVRQKASFMHRSSPSDLARQRSSSTARRTGSMDPNKAAIKYCKCALLFFVALIVTWVPSTVNRIYTIFRPDRVVFGSSVAAATVLPLQGFWNTIIYMVTSAYAVRSLWREMMMACGVKYPEEELPPQLRHQGSISAVRELEDCCSMMSRTHYDADGSSSQNGLTMPGGRV